MTEYNELQIQSEPVVTVSSLEPDYTKYQEGEPGFTTPSQFYFGGLGASKDKSVTLTIQTDAFKDVGFNGVPPEALLVAVRAHFIGLQQSSLKCAEFNAAINQLTDTILMLKSRNEARVYYDKYGTTLP